MSGKSEMVYEPDTDVDIEECKREPTDTDGDTIAGGEDIDPLNTDQESEGASDKVKTRKRVGSNDEYSCDQCEYAGSRHQVYRHKKS